MSDTTIDTSPARLAANESSAQVLNCLNQHANFLLEAGAGAGKTYSLIETLKYLLETKNKQLSYNNQQIACITYTNAATDVINSRIDNSSLVFTDTIHAFCWSIIKNFQSILREKIKSLDSWQERLADSDGIVKQRVEYDLGYRGINEEFVSLHHDDVLALTVLLLPLGKFQKLMVAKYPYILIDEYQDTNNDLMQAIKIYLIECKNGSLVALFGDHWQKIYDKTCGYVTATNLIEISKKANFRSAKSIVDVLNNMRPTLPQAIKDESFIGFATAYHTNSWQGERRTGAGGGHWKGDLPADIAHTYRASFIEKLKNDGWDFSPEKTKVLMLTHNLLASEMGYFSIAQAFTYTDSFIKKENDYIAFFIDKIEPACDAYLRRKYGEMFSFLGTAAPRISLHSEKEKLSIIMNKLILLRNTSSIGDVIDCMKENGYPFLPENILKREAELSMYGELQDEELPSNIKTSRKLRQIAYKEVIALEQFINGHTPFATKHSVKGNEFENVVIIVGRGWNKYDFNQYLELASAPQNIPAEKQKFYELNRNLFYVSCSRPTTRLAILFTQELSSKAIATLQDWFGKESVTSFNL